MSEVDELARPCGELISSNEPSSNSADNVSVYMLVGGNATPCASVLVASEAEDDGLGTLSEECD